MRLFIFILMLIPALTFGQEMMLSDTTASGGGGGPWTPESLSNLVMWLNPRDASSLTLNGTAIDEIRDQTVYGNDSGQTSIGRKPELISSTYFNSQDVMEFDDVTGSTADEFEEGLWSGTTPTITRSDWTYCAVLRWTDPGDDFQRAFSMSNGGNDYNSQGAVPCLESSTGPFYGVYLSGNRATYSTLEDNAAFYCSTCSSSTVKTFVWLVGGVGTPSVQTSSYSAGTNVMTTYQVGGEVSQNFESFFSGEMGEVMFWKAVHVQADLQKLFDDYIKTDYGF